MLNTAVLTRVLATVAIALGSAAPCLPLSIAPESSLPLGPAVSTCLPGERGYLRASLRGAIDTELNWRGAELQCEGGARPGGHGLRVSFLGPPDTKGHRLRLVFGLGVRPGLSTRSPAATNITVIVEGQSQVYTTRGDDRCTVESLVQEPVIEAGLSGLSPAPSTYFLYRVAARGFCIDPAATLDQRGRLYINRFDFAGLARFEDNDLHAAAPQP